MARIRTVKPEFWDDDAIGALSRDARLLFIATWTFADDEGLIRWSSSYLKATALMYDDDVFPDDVQKWMDEIEEYGFVFTYAAGRSRQKLGYIVNFRKHQRIDKPQTGRLPPPSLHESATILMYARRDGFLCHLCHEPVHEVMASRPVENLYDPGRPPDETGRNPSPDHVIPRSKGGTDYPTNIRTSHVSCNKGRGARSVEEAQVSIASRKGSRNGLGSAPGGLHEPSAPDWKGREGKGTEKEGLSRG